jgi:GNAT superfamily N-acetyltransferase
VIRRASPSELEWVNDRYREVDFVPSSTGDVIAIAEVDGNRAGIARVVPLDDGRGELGGMYVFEPFRGRGVAQELIRFLIAATNGTLYCLPFASLHALYASFGFTTVAASSSVPEEITKKHRWCNEHYTEAVLLLEMRR